MLEAFQSLRVELTTKNQIRPLFVLPNLVHPVLLSIWTYPLRDLELTYKPRIWMWTTVQHSLLVSYLTSMIPRISTLLHLNYLRKRSRTNPKSIATLAVGMKLNPGLPRINLMILPNLKSTLIRVNTNQGPDMSSSSGEDQSPVARHRSSKPSGAQPSGAVSDQDLPQHDPDPPYYREVALSDIPSQYAEEVDTFGCILSLPDPRESMPSSSTSFMGLDDEKGHQELRTRGPSSILPLSSVIKDAFNKFQHDFKAANLPEGKYVKPPPSTSKWYRVGQPCYQDKYQELILLNPLGPLWARSPYQFSKNWSIRQGKISRPSISPLPLLQLLLLAMLPMRSVNIALSQLSRRLSHRSKKVPILKKQQSMDMRKSVSTWIFGIRQFLFNTGPLHASANP